MTHKIEFAKLIIPIVGMLGGVIITVKDPSSQVGAAILSSGITGYFGHLAPAAMARNSNNSSRKE